MKNHLLIASRNSRMDLDQVYFWTDTIHNWNHLLNDCHKEIIINQLQWLVKKNLIQVYSFVIMPNHIHIIWKLLSKNGKEMPHASFNKWTSNNFLKSLREKNPSSLKDYTEETPERNHRFWQRDPLAVLMDSREKMEQKLNYIHLNPLAKNWKLVKTPEEYKWSSANFYLTGHDEFEILTHYMDYY